MSTILKEKILTRYFRKETLNIKWAVYVLYITEIMKEQIVKEENKRWIDSILCILVAH